MSRKKDGKPEVRKDRAEIDVRVGPEEAASRLESLANGLREGRIALDDTPFAVTPSGDIDLEIQARSKKRKGRIKLSLSFRIEESSGGDEASDEAEGSDEPENSNNGSEKPVATLPDTFSF